MKTRFRWQQWREIRHTLRSNGVPLPTLRTCVRRGLFNRIGRGWYETPNRPPRRRR